MTTPHLTLVPSARGRWSPERVAEVVDALGRRQREVPRWVLAEARELCGASGAPCGAHASAERALLAACVPRLLELPAPRAAILVAAATAAAARPLLGALLDRGAVEAVVVADVVARAARRGAASLAAWRADAAALPVATDPTVDLALPRALPHPRLHLCLGNALGACGTVGAVRLLRVVRASMGAADRLVLGVDPRRDRAALEDEGHDRAGATAACHLRVLALLNRGLGADFDAQGFAYRVVYDDEARRVDTHLVALRPARVAVAGRGALALRAGESIRTAVDCKYDRGRLAAMLEGVGLRLEAWWDDAAGRAALVVAAPAA